MSRSYPAMILPDLLWSVSQPVPQDMAAFRSELVRYAGEIGAEQDFSEFDTLFPGTSVDIRYKYSERLSSGEWRQVHETLHIRSEFPLSHGQIVLHLHQVVHAHLGGGDHHYFEGIARMSSQITSGVPAYELWTGS